MESPRWNIITPSQYEWERRGLDFIRTGLPDHDPYRAWANFEFQTDDGAIYEVDLLVLTKQGFWLVECKAWGGRIYGDTGTWTRSQDGKLHSEDNPVLLANRKAKALASLLKVQPALAKVRLPWLDALVFLSAEDLQCELTGNARNRVLLRDKPKTEHRPEQKGILAALINREGPGIDADLRGTIDIKVAKALSRAMEQAGIRPSQRSRRVGDYVLGDLIFDGPGYQDRLAKHASFDNVFCRVRQYTVAQTSSEDRERLKRAAAREFQIIQTLDHQNILPVLDYKEHENGPALLFRYLDPNAVRFDHFLATHGHKLETGQRLDLLRQLADAIRHAHRKRVIHRSLGPQSILVSDASSPSPRLQVYNWQVGVRENTSTSGRVTNVEDLVEAQSLVYMSPEALSDSRKVTEASDIFSLGAIAFHLFANRPPASNSTELAKTLRDQKGLSISSVLDGAGPKLEELIQWSTHPDVLTRIGSVEDFLTLLGDVEDELTAPKETVVNDPLQAKQGDRLPHGFVVKRELGQGATAKALLVVKDDKESVLKVALTEDDNSRLHEEAEALRSIHSEFIVAIEQELKMSGRTVLVLQKAGDQTLAAVLAKEGVPSLDLLSRYGDDLLSALCSLERHGVVHRDIKPDNIGIRSLTKQRNQLILFDFSLARASLDNINVGTEGYRDPFLKLRKPPRWDLAAETTEPYWSQRAISQIGEVRMEYPCASCDQTMLVQQPNGEVQWWTFAGGLANTLVMDHLGGGSKAKTDVLLSNLIPKSGRPSRWIYEYDFGDGWRHEVLFEGTPTADAKAKYPLCVEGERACPPEDCGGPWGYADYLAAIRDPKHEQHDEMLEWRGPFDPEAFDTKKATKEMRKIK